MKGGQTEKKLNIEQEDNPFLRSDVSISKFTRKPGVSGGASQSKPKSVKLQSKISLLQKDGKNEIKLDRTPPSSRKAPTSPTQRSQSLQVNRVGYQRSQLSPQPSKRQRTSQRIVTSQSLAKEESRLWNPLVTGETSRRVITRISKNKRQIESDWKESSRLQLRRQKEDQRRQKEFIDDFRKYLETNKSNKVVLYCTCPEKKADRFRRFLKSIDRFFKKAGRFTWIACCPPLPSYQVNKAAFWPPERFYIFFRDPMQPGLVDPLKAEMIIRKANKNCLGNKYRIAPDHACCKEKLNVEGFIVETVYENHLGCAMVHMHSSASSRCPLTILYAHSNGEDLYDILYSAPDLLDMAAYFECDVVTFDYSGYGISSGRADEDHLYTDVEAVYLHVIEKLKVPSDRIILLGYSIGTAAIVHLARKCGEKYPPAGVVLLAPMCTVFSVVCGCCSPKCEHAIRADRYNNFAKISSITAPVLIIHGEKDTVVPVGHGRKLHRKIAENSQRPGVEPLWIPDGKHNQLTNHFPLWERVKIFLKREIIQPKSRITPKTSLTQPLSSVKTEQTKPR
ncbi:unnamed protein product, partial [Mesorhabditis belari]|uniref:Serine aminopeptidase S33 domain-containing protein n=1 Tax=Mesorhabditis belari TaxID=2138241 RepID=A0AAF3EZG6_9BILA